MSSPCLRRCTGRSAQRLALNLRQKLCQWLLIQVSIIGVLVQPVAQMLFRPEEIIHHSPASLLDPDAFGVRLGDLASADLHVDRVAAVSARIGYLDRLIG